MKKKALQYELLKALLKNETYENKMLNDVKVHATVSDDYDSLDEQSERYQKLDEYRESYQKELEHRLSRMEKRMKKMKKRMKMLEYDIMKRTDGLENDMYEQGEWIKEKEKKMKQQQYEMEKMICKMGGFILGKAYAVKSINSLNKKMDKRMEYGNVIDPDGLPVKY